MIPEGENNIKSDKDVKNIKIPIHESKNLKNRDDEGERDITKLKSNTKLELNKINSYMKY